jgi:hypothetical protein
VYCVMLLFVICCVERLLAALCLRVQCTMFACTVRMYCCVVREKVERLLRSLLKRRPRSQSLALGLCRPFDTISFFLSLLRRFPYCMFRPIH